MSFWEHVDELRSRLLKCLWVFLAGFIAAYFLSDRLISVLTHPLFSQLPIEKRHLYYTGLFENFFIHLHVAACASILLLSPVFFFIFWGFISPGLHDQEKNHALPFMLGSSLFFILGAAFAYFVLLPAGVKYFLSYGTTAEVAWLTLESYINLILKILMGFGLAFQLPVIIVLLVKLEVVSVEKMASHRKNVTIAIAILAALIAPPDAISMLLLMAPLYLLFEGAIVFSRVVQKKKHNPLNTNGS